VLTFTSMAATDGTTSTDASLSGCPPSSVVVDSVRVLADCEELGTVLLRELPKSVPSRKLIKKLLRRARVHVKRRGLHQRAQAQVEVRKRKRATSEFEL
jgi:hypothetical protein